MDKTIVKFVNVDGGLFQWQWDGETSVFKAGEERLMENWKAQHFAKHLIDQILNNQNKSTGEKAAREVLLAEIVQAPDEEVAEVPVVLPKKGKKGKEKEFDGKEV